MVDTIAAALEYARSWTRPDVPWCGPTSTIRALTSAIQSRDRIRAIDSGRGRPVDPVNREIRRVLVRELLVFELLTASTGCL